MVRPQFFKSPSPHPLIPGLRSGSGLRQRPRVLMLGKDSFRIRATSIDFFTP